MSNNIAGCFSVFFYTWVNIISRPWRVSHGIICSIMRWRGWLEGLDCEAVIQDVLAKLWARSQLKRKRWKRRNDYNMDKKKGNKSQKSLRHWKIIMKKCWGVRGRNGAQAECFSFKSWLISFHYSRDFFRFWGRKLFQMLNKTVLRTRATCTDRTLDRWTYVCTLVIHYKRVSWFMDNGDLSNVWHFSYQQRDTIKNTNTVLLV